MARAPTHWQQRSRDVIAAALAHLPADADRASRRRALRDAYPFGTREHWPYKVWCREVRAALAALDRQVSARLPGVVRWTPLGVLCSWCGHAGCLACADTRLRPVSREGRRQLAALLSAGAGCQLPVLGDFLKDHGLDDFAARLAPRTKKRPFPERTLLAPFYDARDLRQREESA